MRSLVLALVVLTAFSGVALAGHRASYPGNGNGGGTGAPGNDTGQGGGPTGNNNDNGRF